MTSAPRPARAGAARAPRLAAGRARAVGLPTRGTTAPNRLRRVDRWLVGTQAGRLRAAADPLVVDLGFGASPVTTVELADRLGAVRPDVEVVGLEIDAGRVAAAQGFGRDRLSFALGGFELPLGGRRPVLVRAMNVLRQYPVEAVGPAWATLQAGLAPEGLLVDGTSDEVGRLSSWLAVEADGPVSLTLSVRLAGLRRPSDVAARLPKALIERNVPGEPVHALLRALDAAWERAAVVQAFGPRQRWSTAVRALAEDGWPVVGGPTRWRLGEVEVAWPSLGTPRPADSRS